MLTLPPPDIERIATHIGVPTSRWYGNCHGIAATIVETDALRDWALPYAAYRLVRGHYLGPIADGSYYGYRKGVLIHAHTWIETGPLIIDPTRFAFDGKSPYIYVGPNDGSYDAGGNVWRTLNEPTLLPYDPTMTVIDLELPAEAARFIALLLEDHPVGGTYPVGDRRMYTYALCMWLANLALDKLGPYAEPFYRALVKAGYGAMLPLDNRDIVLGDVYRKGLS